jgi:hypothetical protein
LVFTLALAQPCHNSGQTNQAVSDSESNSRIERWFSPSRHGQPPTNEIAPSQAEIDAYLKRQTATPRVYRAGVYGVISIHGTVCWVGLQGGRTNVVGFLPIPSQAFEAKLFDPAGNELPKTDVGKKFGQPLERDKEFKEYLAGDGPGAERQFHDGTRRLLYFDGGAGNDHYWEFDVSKSFQIRRLGEHRLVVQPRLFIADTNGVFHQSLLPLLQTNVTVLKRPPGT